MPLPKELAKVTPVSKLLTFIVMLALPYLGFLFGIQYQSAIYNARTQQIVCQSNQITNQDTQAKKTSIIPAHIPEKTVNQGPWKHYANQPLGFAIDYPGNLVAPTVTDGGVNTTIDFPNGFRITYGDFYDKQNRKLLSYDEMISNYSVYHQVSDYTIDGRQGKKFISQSTADEGGVEYLFPGIYAIYYYKMPDSSQNSTKVTEFEEMLKTLRFADKNGDINPIDESGKWHIYTHSDYSFKYPLDWYERQGTSCPSFAPATIQYYTIDVCSYYENSDFLADKLSILPEGFTEISRRPVSVDGHEGIEQDLRFQSRFYGNIYLQSIGKNNSEESKHIFEISLSGVPEKDKTSALQLFDQIKSSFKLNFPQ